jgi:hypothetical protein
VGVAGSLRLIDSAVGNRGGCPNGDCWGGEFGGSEVGGGGAAVGGGAVKSDWWPSGGGRWSVEVAEVSGNGEAGCGGGFESEAFDRDGGSLENATVEGGRAASEEGFDLVTGAEGGPAAARAFDGEPLGKRFGGAAFPAEGDRAEGEGGVAFPDDAAATGGGERERQEVGRAFGGGTTGRADEGEAELALVSVVDDETRALEKGHLAGGGRRSVRRLLVGRCGVGRFGRRVGVVPVRGCA